MIPLIEQRLEAIRTTCRRHGVLRLAVFGSAADPNSFDPQRSDVDFIVSFHRGKDLGPWLAEYFNLRSDLADALGHPVDLVMEEASRDLVFGSGAGPMPRVIYAATDSEAA